MAPASARRDRRRPGSADADASFYEGKVASARFFARAVLPKTRLRRELAEAEDGSLTALDDASF